MSTPTTHLLDPQRYRVTFARSTHSELRKITGLRSTWLLLSLMILLYAGIVALLAYSQNEFSPTISEAVSEESLSFDINLITLNVTFALFFTLALGIVATTNEYASHTMRTTALSDPNRIRSFAAKHTAVAIIAGIANALLTLVAVGVYTFMFKGRPEFSGEDARILAMFWGVLTVSALIGTSVGYLLRHTAGAITATFVVLIFGNAVSLINIDWVRNTLVHYMPLDVANAAVSSLLPDPALESTNVLSWELAGLVWVIYALLLAGGGLLRLRSHDI